MKKCSKQNPHPQSSSSFSDHGDSESSFAKTEEQINQVQNEILEQGQEIEKFIDFHNKNHKPSTTLKTLETLFNLFKSELSMNLALRRGLLKEKGRTEELSESITNKDNEISGFFTSLGELLEIEIPNFEFALKVISKKLSDLAKQAHRHSDMKHKSDELQSELQLLRDQNAELESRIEILSKEKENSDTTIERLNETVTELEQSVKDEQANFSLELANITARIDFSDQEKEQLRKEKEAEVSVLKKRISELEGQQLQCTEMQMRLTSTSQESFSLRQQLQKANMTANQLDQRNQLLQSEVEALQQHNEEILKEKAQVSARFIKENGDLKTQIAELSEQMEQQSQEMRNEHSKVCARLNKENENLKNQLTELSGQMEQRSEEMKNEHSRICSKLTRENANLKNQISELSDQLEQRSEELKNEHSRICSKLTRENANLKSQITELSDLCDQQSEQTHASTRLAKENAQLKNKINELTEKLNATPLSSSEDSDFIRAAKGKIQKLRAERNNARKELQTQKENAFKKIEEFRMKIQALEASPTTERYKHSNGDFEKLRALESQINSMKQRCSSMNTENRQLCVDLRNASHEINRLENENARLLTIIDKLKREINGTRNIAGPAASQPESPYRSTFMTFDYDETTTSESSEAGRPFTMATLVCNKLENRAADSLCSNTLLESPSAPGDVRSEINSLQRGIDSLKKELNEMCQ